MTLCVIGKGVVTKDDVLRVAVLCDKELLCNVEDGATVTDDESMIELCDADVDELVRFCIDDDITPVDCSAPLDIALEAYDDIGIDCWCELVMNDVNLMF